MSTRKCPICGRATVEEWKPFCSKRCADVDLNRWLSDSYVIPARDDEPRDDGDITSNGDDEN
ncbi:MAG: DNA gyrase inhibitor YacG [Candidatus Devosia phytovorans]|uniref:DNA gyrase inhibitor YacG n=1 Tax=Candidatus Devosia phytovorans TaxID=3121372 RepID=A0AAJ5VR80_9HYPH|nr:DNA gyrase inhibitor YacG [Devosia sp.]WEK03268.1 MAG: DNA gyrase inhibitor YacG [Devosia sp.]